MGNSQARGDEHKSSGGGIFNCCSGSQDNDTHLGEPTIQQRRIIFSARSMHQDADSDGEDGSKRASLGAQYQDSVPLQHTYDQDKQPSANSRKSGTFNLKEQLRLDSGLTPSPVIKMMSFAQRKYMGFRCKYEYDAKALLLCTEKQICVLSYTLQSVSQADGSKVNLQPRHRSFKESDGVDHATEEDMFTGFHNKERQAQVLLRWQADGHHTIRHCSFVDDERPHYIFIMLEDNQTHEMLLKLLRIQGKEFWQLEENGKTKKMAIQRKLPFSTIETEEKTEKLQKIVRQKFSKGEVTRKAGQDNFYCNLSNIRDLTNEENQEDEQGSILDNSCGSSKVVNSTSGGGLNTSEHNTAGFGSFVSQGGDIEEAKHQGSKGRMKTEVDPDPANSSEDEQFQLIRTPSKTKNRRHQQQPSQGSRTNRNSAGKGQQSEGSVSHKRCKSQASRQSRPNQKQDFFLNEISCERIQSPREYISYVWFSQHRLVFFFQKAQEYPTQQNPMEMFYVNNWLFFRKTKNIFEKPSSGAAQQMNSPQNGLPNQVFKSILEKEKRALHYVRGQVKHSDTLDSQVYLIYKSPATVLDVFNLEGRHVAGFDLRQVIHTKLSPSITLQSLDFVQVPVLKWTGRRNKLLKSFGQYKKVFEAAKVVLIGQALVENVTSKCLIIFNLKTLEVEKLKVLSFLGSQTINCVSYGPFDNGHILLGLSDGWLLAYEYPSLERIESKQIFLNEELSQKEDLGQSSPTGSKVVIQQNDQSQLSQSPRNTLIMETNQSDGDSSFGNLEDSTTEFQDDQATDIQQKHSIVSIQIDPTNLVLACSRDGQVVALTPFDRRHNYFYLELGEETFCTVGMPSARAKEIRGDVTALETQNGCCM